MRAEVPSPEADRAPLATVALVAALFLALGMSIARWTVRPLPPSAELTELGEIDALTEIDEPGEPAPAVEAPEIEAEIDAIEPAAEPAPEPPGPTPALTTPGPTTPGPTTPEPAAAIDAPEIAPPARGPARSRLVRGRVAYLRCEGGASGGSCERDPALEDAIWTAIGSLPTCATGPSGPGQADLVVERNDEGIEVRARDTFAPDVVRLDAPSTVACLAPVIVADPVIAASTRRVFLSFRFSLEAL